MNTNLTTKLNIISCTFIPQEEALALPLQKLKNGKHYIIYYHHMKCREISVLWE